MLTSQLFAGEPLLQAIADDLDQPITGSNPRISQQVNRNDTGVRQIQIALLNQDPQALPLHGADGDYGEETAQAIVRFKRDVLLVPPEEMVDDIGPRTVLKLDELQTLLETPDPPPPPPVEARPEEWLLGDPEMLPFRSPAFTFGNDVVFHVDSQSYMDSLADRFDQLINFDQVLAAGWRFSAEQRLRSVDETSPGIQERLIRLHQLGVKVRVLLFGPLFSTAPFRVAMPALPSKDNFEFSTALRAAGIEAVLDARLPRFGAHHQKCFVVQSAAEGPVAFVGGIDICVDRWDDAGHHDPAHRQREPDFLGEHISMPGWHDVQLQVHGPAVGQVWSALSQRWNDPTLPSGIEPRPATIDANEAPGPPVRQRTHVVQVLRTLTCNGVYSFLPGGERSVLAAYKKAIARARHYIHIEDQYMWTSHVVDDLRDAAARGVHVVLVTSRDFDLPEATGMPAAHRAMRQEAVSRIASGNPANVHFFHLERAGTSEQIYVHAKLMIVDDLYVAAGSANLNFRSQTTDSELHVGVFDSQIVEGMMGGAPAPVGQSIRDLRSQIWAEHINDDPALVQDPIASLGELPGPDQRRGHLVGKQLPPGVAPFDGRDSVLKLLQTLVQMENFGSLGTALLGPLNLPFAIGPGIDLAIAAGLIPDPQQFMKDFLNPNTICA